jgi:hypothetical protein
MEKGDEGSFPSQLIDPLDGHIIKHVDHTFDYLRSLGLTPQKIKWSTDGESLWTVLKDGTILKAEIQQFLNQGKYDDEQ